MARATWLLATTTVIGLGTSLWLYRANRALHDALDAPTPASAPLAAAAPAAADPWSSTARSPTLPAAARSAAISPTLPAVADESRLDRRVRRRQEFAAMFGRLDGESAADYKARIGPLIDAGLAIPRSRVADMRKEAELKAHVTPEQSRALDQAFDKTYSDVLDFANHAIADGQLSPYEPNVAGMLDFAGGLGGILTETQGQIGKVLSADQMQTMHESGFEWGEYLGAEAPWDQLDAPPPPKPAPAP